MESSCTQSPVGPCTFQMLSHLLWLHLSVKQRLRVKVNTWSYTQIKENMTLFQTYLSLIPCNIPDYIVSRTKTLCPQCSTHIHELINRHGNNIYKTWLWLHVVLTYGLYLSLPWRLMSSWMCMEHWGHRVLGERTSRFRHFYFARGAQIRT